MGYQTNAGDGDMVTLAGYIADGAMAFLRAEWKVLSYFVVVAGLLLAWSGTTVVNFKPCYCHIICMRCISFGICRLFGIAHCY